ncbi:MAG: succinate-semialdehyde dehydrogenase [Myxococcales bacterium]|nr:succinate-semialdehyde dehydrogenase [Myxococcales bacterium]
MTHSAAEAFMLEEHAHQLLHELRQAQTGWGRRPVADRVAMLREAGQAILSRAEELAKIVCEETHKPLVESYASEILGVADLFAYWCDHGPKLLEPRKGLVPMLDMPGKKARVERLPRGVVALISPWNYPVAIPMRTIVPALLAGNAVALKPSEHTPRSGAWLVARLREVLGPVVGLMEGAGDAGAALVKAGPDMVVFTGSTRTGRKVAVACAEQGIPCECELGGKDCAVVLRDADIDRAAAGICWGVLTNAGQNCAGIERIAVHADIAPRFTRALVWSLEQAARDVPRLVTAAQRDLVARHVQDALDHGARLLTGGIPDDPDAPIPPTLLADVPRDRPAWVEESFGPIAVLEVCDTDQALIAAANDTRFALGASVWGAHEDHAERVGEQLRSGMVWINNHSFTGALPDLPWTGTGASGTGVTNSPEALHHMTRPRLVVVDSATATEPWWYPYGDAMLDLMRAAVRRQAEGGLGNTLKTLVALRKRAQELNQR